MAINQRFQKPTLLETNSAPDAVKIGLNFHLKKKQHDWEFKNRREGIKFLHEEYIYTEKGDFSGETATSLCLA